MINSVFMLVFSLLIFKFKMKNDFYLKLWKKTCPTTLIKCIVEMLIFLIVFIYLDKN